MESSLNRWGKQLIFGEEKQSNNNKSSSSSPSDDEDDCVILDGDPDKPVRVAVENNNGSQEYGSSDELLIVAEKGQIACRDYPHPRHLCARFPFNTNPHEKHCDMCHCYVCDTRAPCAYWGTGKSSGDHCHSTDKELEWRVLRQSSKQCKTTLLPTSIHSAIPLSNVPPQHPTLSRSETLNSDEEREVLSRLRLALNRLSLQSDRLTGTVKWFNSQKGYGFICSDGGGEDLFVHQSSIKSEGYQSLSEGELVEFQIEIGDDRRKQAIDVRVPGGSSVPVTTRRETYSSDTSKSYNCGETGHLARNCSNTGSDDGETILLAGLRLLALEALDRLTVEADRLTGTVKWFNSHKGYGFITPGDGGEDLFVHQSSIKSKGYRSLAEGEVVEFRIESGDDGKKKAIDVSGPGGSFVRGTARRENYCSDIDGCYICGERGHLARNCSHTGSGGGKDYDGSYTSQCYNCGEMGHLTRDCYHKGSDGGGGRSTYNGTDISECSNYGDLRWRDGHGRGSKNSGGRPGAARNSPSKDYGWNKGFGVSSGGSFSQGTTSRDIYGRGNSNNGSDTLKCYNCGEMGHLVRHCNGGSRGVNVSHTSESNASSNFRGGGRGGGTKDCGGDSECHPCRDSGSQKAVNVRSPGGYFVREHTRKDYYCSRVGRKGDHAGGGNFYSGGDSCAERGHSLSYCHDKGTGGLAGSSSRCYTCGETGHRARDCFEGNGGEGGGSGGACYNCGEHGHLARDCGDLNWGNSGGNGRLACYYCGEFGHTRKHCPTSNKAMN